MTPYQQSQELLTQLANLSDAMFAHEAKRNDLILEVGKPAYDNFMRLNFLRFKQAAEGITELQRNHFAEYHRARRDALYTSIEPPEKVSIEMDIEGTEPNYKFNVFSYQIQINKKQSVGARY